MALFLDLHIFASDTLGWVDTGAGEFPPTIVFRAPSNIHALVYWVLAGSILFIIVPKSDFGFLDWLSINIKPSFIADTISDFNDERGEPGMVLITAVDPVALLKTHPPVPGTRVHTERSDFENSFSFVMVLEDCQFSQQTDSESPGLGQASLKTIKFLFFGLLTFFNLDDLGAREGSASALGLFFWMSKEGIFEDVKVVAFKEAVSPSTFNYAITVGLGFPEPLVLVTNSVIVRLVSADS